MSKSGTIYRFLLQFYPRKYRQEFGEEMECIFSESLKDAYLENGERGVLELWGRTLFDTGKRLFAEGTQTERRKMVDSQITLTGVIFATYEPSEELKTV